MATESRIPTLSYSNVQHQPLIEKFYQLVASTCRFTIVCGAGISTHAGIPDFRSKDGLLHQKFGDRGQLRGSELFESATVRREETRVPFNQEMTRMKIISRNARQTSCHLLIARLYDRRSLLRCYTQNIDGMQTRGREDMGDIIFELHGTNIHLKCILCNQRPKRPASDFDQQLLSEGRAMCLECAKNPMREVGNSRNLRRLTPGELIPDILFNDQEAELCKNGKTIDRLAIEDAKCHMLLIIGTRLRPFGVSKLVKGLAAQVHQSGGVVVHVDWTALPGTPWKKYVDLHVEMDIEEWSKGCIQALGDVHKAKKKSWVSKQVSALAEAARYTSLADVAHTSNACQSSFTPPPMSDAPILLVVLHAESVFFDARAFAAQMRYACGLTGRECSSCVVEINRLEGDITIPTGWSSFYLVLIYISGYTRLLQSGEKSHEIMWMLEYASERLGNIAPRSLWSLAFVVCQDNELLFEPDLSQLNMCIQRTFPFDTIAASVDLKRLQLKGWVNIVLEALSSSPRRDLRDPAVILDHIINSWMEDLDAFKYFNLVVFNKQLSPFMILASHSDERSQPFGRPLPDVGAVCPCVVSAMDEQKQVEPMIKRWVVCHNAQDRQLLSEVHASVSCLCCGATWQLPCKDLHGTVRSVAGRYSVQIPLDAPGIWVSPE